MAPAIEKPLNILYIFFLENIYQLNRQLKKEIWNFWLHFLAYKKNQKIKIWFFDFFFSKFWNFQNTGIYMIKYQVVNMHTKFQIPISKNGRAKAIFEIFWKIFKKFENWKIEVGSWKSVTFPKYSLRTFCEILIKIGGF